jgi:superfamily II DNA or RNA helicase
MSEALVLEVDNCVTSIVQGKLNKDQYQGFRRALGWRPEDYKFAVKAYAEKMRSQAIAKGYSYDRVQQEYKRAMEWDGYQSNVRYNAGHCGFRQKRKYTHFDTGLLSNAREFFDKYNIPYSLIDSRGPEPKRDQDLVMSEWFEERDYQTKARKQAVLQKRGIIKCSTGGGKTGIAASIISDLGVAPFIFYVTSIDLLQQAYDELTKFIRHNGVPLEVGRVGGGHKDIKDITVMTVQTAIKSLDEKYVSYDAEESKIKDKTDYSDIKQDIKDLIRGAKGIVADEIQHWASKTAQVISDHSESAYYKYGMSATPWRDMGDDILIDACFGKTICDISASFLIRRGYLVKPEIYFINVPDPNCGYKTYQKIYKHALKENDFRNEYIAKLTNKFYESGKHPLCLVNHIDHGDVLNGLINESSFIHGSVSKKKREAHLDLMRERKCGPTIATSIFDEGVDVKPLDALILAGSGKSATRALQRIGRIIRPWPNVDNNQKKSAVAIDFMDSCKYLNEHAKKRLKIYQTEPEFDIKFLDLK